MSLVLGAARALARGLAAGAPREWPAGSRSAPRPDARPMRVLVNISAGIGDALMALPMVRVLLAAHPGNEVTLLATPANGALLGPEPGIAAVVPWPAAPTPAQSVMIARRLRAGRFDAALCALPSDLVSTCIVLRLAGIPARVKHRLENVERCRDWQFLFTDLVNTHPAGHKVVENLGLLTAVGVAEPQRSVAELVKFMQLTLSDAERRAAAARFPRAADGGPRIGMHPGCKPGWEFKRWEPRNFAALADLLAARQGADVVWFGGPDEAGLVASIMQAMRSASISVAGTLGVRESAALMAGCDAFVSNDSGPMHMATAAGVPTVGLFSSANPRTQPSRTGPFGPAHTIIARPDLQAIGVEEVAAAVAATLTSRRGEQ